MTARLVVSLSGLAGATTALDAARALTAELDARAVPLAHLLTPHGTPEPGTAGWLAERLAGRDELVLHGFRPQRPQRGRLAAHETGLQLIAAQAAVHARGLRPECFAPDRRLAALGTMNTLRRNGFRICAEHNGVRDLTTERLLPGRLLTFGNQHSGNQHSGTRHRGQRVEPWRCLAVVLAAGRTARRDGLVRIAVNAADLRRPGIRQAVLDAVDIALHHGAEPGTHATLFAPAPSTVVLPVQRRRADQRSVASSLGSTVKVEPSGLKLSNMP